MLNFPLSITKDKKTVNLNKNYESEIPIRLGKMHLTANSIIQKHIDNKEFIDITYLTEQDFNIVFTHYTEKTLIYTITDTDEKAIPYSFVFVVEGK